MKREWLIKCHEVQTKLHYHTSTMPFQPSGMNGYQFMTINSYLSSSSYRKHSLITRNHNHWRIQGGGGGTRDARPSKSNFFHFHAVSAKILSSNMFLVQTQGLAPPPPTPVWEILDPPLIIQIISGYNNTRTLF